MICVPIFEKTHDYVLKSAKKALEMGADLLEFRIDALEEPDADKVRDIIETIDHPLIATNRMSSEGGFFDGSEEERVEILLEAAKASDFVDVELKTAEKYRSKIIKASKTSIVSFHDFKKTPTLEELLDVVKSEKEIGDIAKFAVMPKDIKDTLLVLEVLSRVQNTVGISMGDLGRYTRIVAPLFGSPITFASFNRESAPGQLDIESTKHILNKIGSWR